MRSGRLTGRLTAAALAATAVTLLTSPAAVGPATAAQPGPASTATATVTATVAPIDRWRPIVPHTSRRSKQHDAKFTIAVMPDTQLEVHKTSDTRFRERSQWLVDHRSALDLRFVTHTGDVVDWDTPDHFQTGMASDALRPLEEAGIPYSLTIGNHDTQATGVGGSARDPLLTHEQQRDTSTFNAFFTASRYGDVRGAFEAGKVDNIYSTFTAAGDDWLVLNLELWPRAAVVEWAKQVVASHPNTNVIVATHSYLTSKNAIYTGCDYGDTSPEYLFDNLIKVYPNIKMVFSGHVGIAGSRTDVGIHGNKIVSYLQTFHSPTTNPVRLVEIDTAKNTISTRIYAPRTNDTYPQYVNHQSGMSWVVPRES